MEQKKENYETLYKSKKLNKIFTNLKQLEEEERIFDEKMAAKEKKDQERKEAADKVKEAYEEARAKRIEADKLMREFLQQYGSWHETISIGDPNLYQNYLDATMNTINNMITSIPRFFITK